MTLPGSSRCGPAPRDPEYLIDGECDGEEHELAFDLNARRRGQTRAEFDGSGDVLRTPAGALGRLGNKGFKVGPADSRTISNVQSLKQSSERIAFIGSYTFAATLPSIYWLVRTLAAISRLVRLYYTRRSASRVRPDTARLV